MRFAEKPVDQRTMLTSRFLVDQELLELESYLPKI